jgi:hypothetical protein
VKLAQQLNHMNNMSSIRAATQDALHVGHTSGGDAVLGLLLGCVVWQPSPPLTCDDFPSVCSRRYEEPVEIHSSI